MNDKGLKVLAAIWTIMSVLFGAAWAVYSRDISMAMTEIRDMKREQVEYERLANERFMQIYSRLGPADAAVRK